MRDSKGKFIKAPTPPEQPHAEPTPEPEVQPATATGRAWRPGLRSLSRLRRSV